MYANTFAHLVRVRKGNSLEDGGYEGDIKKISRGIKRWGLVTFKKSFHGTGRTLEIGRQQDGSSCGICVANSIEHHIFGTSLFTHNERNNLRVYYFKKTVGLLLNDVSTISFLTQQMTRSP